MKALAFFSALLAVLLLAPAAQAAPRLTATGVRVGSHPAFVRAVVDVQIARGGLSDAAWRGIDVRPFDGRAVVQLRDAGLGRGVPEPVPPNA